MIFICSCVLLLLLTIPPPHHHPPPTPNLKLQGCFSWAGSPGAVLLCQQPGAQRSAADVPRPLPGPAVSRGEPSWDWSHWCEWPPNKLSMSSVEFCLSLLIFAEQNGSWLIHVSNTLSVGFVWTPPTLIWELSEWRQPHCCWSPPNNTLSVGFVWTPPTLHGELSKLRPAPFMLVATQQHTVSGSCLDASHLALRAV